MTVLADPTDGLTPQPSSTPVLGLEERWGLVLEHRQELIRVARRRTVSLADAEDCVSAAMVKAVEFRDLDPARVGPFLNTVVMRLAADTHRDRDRLRRAGVRTLTRELPPVVHDEDICDRDEARWVQRALGGLKGREKAVLAARAQGRSVEEICREHKITPKAAECALARARTKARSLLASTLAALLGLVLWPRRHASTVVGVTVPAAALTALALALAGPQTVQEAPSSAPRLPAPSPSSQAEAAAEPRSAAPALAAVQPAAAQRAAAPAPVAKKPVARRAPSAAAERRLPVPLPRVEAPARNVVDVARVGGVKAGEQAQGESLEQSLRRCGVGQLLSDPAAGACRTD